MLYFAYGMNTNREGMRGMCPQARRMGVAKLLDCSFRFAGCADIILDETAYVDGLLWDITDDFLLHLDCLEGYPHFYDRGIFQVEFNGEILDAMSYFMTPGHETRNPSSGYLNTVVTGYRENGIPMDQIYNALLVPELVA